MSSSQLYGIHDPGGEHLLPKGGWIVFTEGIGCDPNDMSGGDYRQWADKGYNVLVRLNNGYGPSGTIPAPNRSGDFGKRCANYVRNSPGATRWIIGNEPNHEQEWPDGVLITAADYANCFRLAADAIHSQAGAHHKVIVAAIAPWTDRAGDWLQYQAQVLQAVAGYADGIALHTYTHGTDRDLIYSTATMMPPYQDRYYHFFAYRQLLGAVPPAMRALPAYITETNQGDVPWADANSGWVCNAYAEINWWNEQPATQKIMCLCLYRWPVGLDRWGIADKTRVHDDLKRSVSMGYKSPSEIADRTTTPVPSPTPAPAPVQPVAPPQHLVDWDPRLNDLDVELKRVYVPPGTIVYRLVKARYLDKTEARGNANIYVDVLDENGVRLVGAPIRQAWQDGDAVLYTEAKPGEPAAVGIPMSSAGNAYQVHVNGYPSDVVTGLGMGTVEERHVPHHTGYQLVFQRSTEGAGTAPGGDTATVPVVTPPTPVPPPVVPQQPPVIIQPPTVTGILDPTVMEAIIAIESGGQGIVDGKPIIRFEPHIFEQYVDADTFKRHFAYGDPNNPAVKPWQNRRMNDGSGWQSLEDEGQKDQWRAYELARRLNPEGAAKSISVGVGQIMGFHHKSLGYPTVDQMLEAFKSVPMQLVGMVNFILGRPELTKAVANKDWRTIARIYNGAGNIDYYAGLLENKYNELLRKRG